MQPIILTNKDDNDDDDNDIEIIEHTRHTIIGNKRPISETVNNLKSFYLYLKII